MESETLTVQLWPAIAAGLGIVTAIVAALVWTFSSFASKIDHADHSERIKALESNWAAIHSDLSYIKGRLEPKT